MYFWIVNCSLAFLLCVLCAGIVIPQILLIAFRKKLFDFPDERKVHHCAVPRLGGIAFKPVVFFTIALLLGINMVLGHSEILSEIGNDVCSLAFAFCSIMVLYLVGMADRYPLSCQVCHPDSVRRDAYCRWGIYQQPIRCSGHPCGAVMVRISPDHPDRGLHHQCHQPD